jgi:hypothetical protein
VLAARRGSGRMATATTVEPGVSAASGSDGAAARDGSFLAGFLSPAARRSGAR